MEAPPPPFVIPTEPRSSYDAAPPTTTRAAFLEESRMKLISATEPYRKSGGSGGICSSLNRHRIRIEAARGGAQRRDLQRHSSLRAVLLVYPHTGTLRFGVFGGTLESFCLGQVIECLSDHGIPVGTYLQALFL